MLFISVVTNAVSMFKIHRVAGLLQIPYVLWSAFASYLNAGNYYLTRTILIINNNSNGFNQ